jgi:threonine aldolase
MEKFSEQFASDNYSGICPEAFKYLEKANQGHDYPYGDDYWTKETCNKLREVFETDCEIFFALTGTAANSLALSSICEPYHSIICCDTSHIETDECGAPEFFSNGSKLLHSKGMNGKIQPELAEETILKRSDIHYPKPKVISLTQATELGTVYTPSELQEIKSVAKKHKLLLHMDGARFANALVTLNAKPKEISWQCGVDLLCLGGTKNGISIGEAVIFFNKKLAEDFEYRCKQAGQLASKMRFIAAQWYGLLNNNTWINNATHSNECAKYLESKLKQIEGLEILFPREANSVFVKFPKEVVEALHKKGWHFYTFIGVTGARLMCSWNTTEKRIDELTTDIKALMKDYK